MHELREIYYYNNKNVRTIFKDGEVWFVAKDVCEILEIKNNRDAISKLDDDEKGVVLTDTLGGPQKMTVINEPGLYNLVLKSRKPEAKEFKRWITHEVLPSIREKGYYINKKLIAADEFEFMHMIIDNLKKQKEAIENNANKIETLNNNITKLKESRVPEDYLTLAGIAQLLDVTSSRGRLHSQLIGAVARKLDFKIDEEPPYEDNYVKVVFGPGQIGSRVYLSPEAADKIIQWWKSESKNYRHEDYYTNNSEYGFAGDLKEIYYQFDKRRYKVFEARYSN